MDSISKDNPMDSETVWHEKAHSPMKGPGVTTLQLQRMLEISRRLVNPPQVGNGSAEPELEAFLKLLISTAAELTGCESASILVMDETRAQLQFLALPTFQQEKIKNVKVPLQSSIAGWVFQNREPALLPEGANEPQRFMHTNLSSQLVTVPGEFRNYIFPYKFRNYFAVPILYHDEALGVLEVVNKTEHAHYTEEEYTILESIACQAAIAMQNTRLMTQVQNSLKHNDQLDRMKSNFIAITSHELRTPLGLILGHATFLQEFIQPEYKQQMEVIVRNAIRLKEIIDDLSRMDNVQRGEASVRAAMMSIPRLVEEVMESHQEQAHKKDITISSDINKQDLMVEGDATKIAIALSNLVENAIIFTNAGGHITIISGTIPGFIKVSVCDDGIGIPSRDLGHIFDRFYQVESHLTRKHGGLGLGLSIAKVMIEMHGGRIWVESEEGKGSNFTFLLPNPSNQVNSSPGT
jgi:signal transduction histidine kinase